MRHRSNGHVPSCIPTSAPIRCPPAPDWNPRDKHDGYRLQVRRVGEVALEVLVAAAAPPSLIDIDRRGKARFVVDVGLTIVVVVHKTVCCGSVIWRVQCEATGMSERPKHLQLNYSVKAPLNVSQNQLFRMPKNWSFFHFKGQQRYCIRS
jgi:hypothetical protein